MSAQHMIQVERFIEWYRFIEWSMTVRPFVARHDSKLLPPLPNFMKEGSVVSIHLTNPYEWITHCQLAFRGKESHLHMRLDRE